MQNLTPLNVGGAHCKIIANKFALFHSLALHLRCNRATGYNTFENFCSIALESPPRNRNEQKNIQLGLYLWVQTEPLYIRLVVSLRALAKVCAFLFFTVKRKTQTSIFMFNHIQLKTMNPKVEEHIKRMKEEERITKEEILVALGLFEIEHTREYHDKKTFAFNQWDNEKKKYYRIIEKKVAIETTDEEYQEILKLSTKTFKPLLYINKKKEGRTMWAYHLRLIAIIMLFYGILMAICLALLFPIDSPDNYYAYVSIYLSFLFTFVGFFLLLGLSRIVEVAERKLIYQSLTPVAVPKGE